MNRASSLRLAVFLGFQDVQGAYHRSALGPLWSVIGLTAQLLTIGTIFGLVFEADLGNYFPYLGIGLTLWTFLAGTVNECSGAYIAAERLLKELPLPYYFNLVRLLSKNSLLFMHNWIIVVGIAVVFPVGWNWVQLLALPGLAILLGNMFWVGTLVALASARYRDFPPTIATLFTVSFFVTPIVWIPARLPEGLAQLVLTLNPFYHWIELVRAPLLGVAPVFENWLTSISMLVLGNFLAWLAAKKFWWRVVYWL